MQATTVPEWNPGTLRLDCKAGLMIDYIISHDIIISLVFPFWFVSFPMYPPTVQEIANCLRPSAPETTDMMQARQEVEAELRARQVRAVWTVFREVWEGLGSDLVNN